MAVSGAALFPPLALRVLGVESEESDRLRKVGRSGSLEGGLLEALVLDEEEANQSRELSWLPLPSFLTKWGWPSPASLTTTWGMFLPCFGFARFGGVAIGFHAP